MNSLLKVINQMVKLFPVMGLKTSADLDKENLYFTIKQAKNRLDRLLDDAEIEIILGDMPMEEKLKLVRILGKSLRRMQQVDNILLARRDKDES